MTDRFFHLLERLQRADRQLRNALYARRQDPVAIVFLRHRKAVLRMTLSRLQARHLTSPAL